MYDVFIQLCFSDVMCSPADVTRVSHGNCHRNWLWIIMVPSSAYTPPGTLYAPGSRTHTHTPSLWWLCCGQGLLSVALVAHVMCSQTLVWVMSHACWKIFFKYHSIFFFQWWELICRVVMSVVHNAYTREGMVGCVSWLLHGFELFYAPSTSMYDTLYFC